MPQYDSPCLQGPGILKRRGGVLLAMSKAFAVRRLQPERARGGSKGVLAEISTECERKLSVAFSCKAKV